VLSQYLVQRRTELSYVPEDILVEVTNVCNLRCRFCPQSDPAHHDIVPKAHATPETIDALLGALRRGGVTTDVIHWTHDGEPFVNRRFHEICAVGAKHGFCNMYFATNAILARPERVDALPRGDCRYTLVVDFSFDREYYESVRGKAGSWQIIRSNLTELLTDPRFAHVSLEVKEISSFSLVDPGEITENVRGLRSLFPRSPRLRIFDKTFHNATGFLGDGQVDRSRRYFLCPYPWMSLSVTASGDVVACCRDLRHKTVLGNLFREPLAEIWNGEPMKRMRRSLVDRRPEEVEACRGCDLPYDRDKFSATNILRAVKGRLQMFS